ncbi:MAG: hypothetical protein Q4A51_04645 [Lachnospiraceae bacterium]|nr:hypothetical protein [Lachnospiraceae bacterium]
MKYLMDDVNKWLKIYKKLDQVSPEVFDCGMLCGSACCTGKNISCISEVQFNKIDWENQDYKPDIDIPVSEIIVNNNSLGIYLLPGEHLLLDLIEDKSWISIELQDPKECRLPESWKYPVYFINCMNPPSCPRKWRPLQCRTFPLKPAFDENGVLEMIWEDEELPYTCPLIEYNAPIHDDFYRVTYEVWSELVKDPRIFDLVMMES